jgi:aspartate 1-decarboxylase
MSYAWLDEAESKRHKPSVIVLDENNLIKKA